MNESTRGNSKFMMQMYMYRYINLAVWITDSQIGIKSVEENIPHGWIFASFMVRCAILICWSIDGCTIKSNWRNDSKQMMAEFSWDQAQKNLMVNLVYTFLENNSVVIQPNYTTNSKPYCKWYYYYEKERYSIVEACT